MEELYEAAHRGSISKLVDRFGVDRTEEIREVYFRHREALEEDSSVKKFVPVFAHMGACRELIHMDELERS